MVYQDDKMCPQCHAEKVAMAKQTAQTHRRHRGRTFSRREEELYIMSAIAGLFLIILLAQLHLLPHL